MASSSLNGMTPAKLRISLILFFLALCIPSILLIRQAYSELKWEALHQYRTQAEALTQQIDQQLQQLINQEEARSFTEYSFLNIAGETTANFLQRSPLANLPVTQAIPGTLGYFQVDNEGNFSTPLLPASKNISQYGISNTDARQRQTIHQQLFNILEQNQLSSGRIMPPKATPLSTDDEAREKTEEAVLESAANEPASSSAIDHAGSPFNKMMDLSSADSAPIETRVKPSIGQSSGLATPESRASKAPTAKISQQAFDALESRQVDAYAKKKQRANGERQTVERKRNLEQQAQAKAYAPAYRAKDVDKQDLRDDMAIQKSIAPGYQYSGKQSRKEISRLPEQEIAPAPVRTMESDAITGTRNARIQTFESEIDPFQLSYLDSGHYVLFRKVWRDNQRYIQGLLIERDKFIQGIIERTFKNTALYAMSNLAVTWNGSVISRLHGGTYERYFSRTQTFRGEPLLRQALSYPLTNMELIYTINHLPASPGASTINWLASILLIVMLVGFYLMYRTGMRQIALNNQQRDFVSAVSHELKTPLTSIRMYGEMLREGWAEENKKKTYYDYIFEESERLTRLINNVLQLARLSRNKIQTNLQTTKADTLLDMMKSRISSQAEKSGFKLEISCDEDTRKTNIQVDTDHFLQIMINLIDNAIKFSVNAENKTIQIGCKILQSGKLQISVRDFGPGIPKDQMKKIFGLFYRAENELTRETVGTGIGLSLVNQLAREMDASVDVRNASPGAEILLCMPTKF